MTTTQDQALWELETQGHWEAALQACEAWEHRREADLDDCNLSRREQAAVAIANWEISHLSH